MPIISTSTTLRKVEHIIASGIGVLDFAVEDETQYYTWHGTEDADWNIEDVKRVENEDEDRLIIFPEADYFVCEIRATGEVDNRGPVRCFCD